MRYFVGLGSNIEPQRHVPLMLRALLGISPTVQVGRVVRTEPVGVVGEPFLNAVAAISTNFAAPDLKASLNAIEASLGRDRGLPGSKTRSRTADLDILFPLPAGAASVPAELLPPEPYVRPMLLELLDALGLPAAAEPVPAAPGVRLELEGLFFGEAPRAFTLVGGRLSAGAVAPAPTARASAGQR